MVNISGFNQFFAKINRIYLGFYKIQTNRKEVLPFLRVTDNEVNNNIWERERRPVAPFSVFYKNDLSAV